MKETLLIVVLLLSPAILAEYAQFECPYGWEDHGEYCYRFHQEQEEDVTGASIVCQEDGAFVLSINSDAEHTFMISMLIDYNPGAIKRDWWTSGRRVHEDPENKDFMQFFWEGDGKKIESYFYWLNDSIPEQPGNNHIIYHFDGFAWGWILGTGDEELVFICKISKEDIYKIIDGDRGPDYGVEEPDPEKIEVGPKFFMQPDNTIFERVQTVGISKEYAFLECAARGVPAPTYDWYRERGQTVVKIDPLEDNRLTQINGRLVIDEPSVDADSEDMGKYQCVAKNNYGDIRSSWCNLEYGYLNDFSRSPRSPVYANAYAHTMIDCQAPKHYPSIVYSWFKDDLSNPVRPDVKQYVFVSQNGRLYFSEVTQADNGLYICYVNKPGVNFAAGKESMPVELRVLEASGGDYDPVIMDGFPQTFPGNPRVGQDVRIECWAKGSFQPFPLEYNWERLGHNDTHIIPMPIQAYTIDQNRILYIPEAQAYDEGQYRCRVNRPTGGSDSKTVEINLDADPYFILELRDRFVDEDERVEWRCIAGGKPSVDYHWFKNAEVLDDSTIPDEDKDRVIVSQNSLTITRVDKDKDPGMYQCAAQNSHSIQYSSAELRVLSFPPSFAKRPLQGNQLATENGNTTMFCQPEAAPAATITWFRNTVPILPDNRVQILPNGNLFISPVWTTDQATYTCRAENIYGEASSTGNLTVLDTVTISYPPQGHAVNVNKTTFLHCTASYNPQMDVTYVWYQGEIMVEFERIYRLGENKYEVWYNPHYKRGSGMFLGGLYVMNAQLEHRARYMCRVESGGSIQEAWAQLEINGPPSEPAGVAVVAGTITTTSAQIMWKNGGDNNKEILSFVVEAFNEWEGFWRILHTNVWAIPDTTETLRYNVTNLRPYSSYLIRLRAENEVGTSVPSVPSDGFTTAPVLPDMYPKYVGGGGGKVGDLVITWQPLEPWEQNGRDIGYYIYHKIAGDNDVPEQKDTVHGNVGRYVILVGQNMYYREYEVAVQAFNLVGDGPRSPTVRIRSAMQLPNAIATEIKAHQFNSTAVLVMWEPVDDTISNIHGKLGGYKVGYWPFDDGEEVENPPRITLNGQASEGLVIGLEPDTRYYFRIYVWNDAGNSLPSQWTIQKTLRLAPINQPVEVQVRLHTQTTIYVNWRGVSTAQLEEPLEGYKVRVWREGEDIKLATDYDAGKEVELYIDDLKPHILYKLRVFGYSRGGDGTMSSPAVKFMLGGSAQVTVSFVVFTMALLCSVFANSS